MSDTERFSIDVEGVPRAVRSLRGIRIPLDFDCLGPATLLYCAFPVLLFLLFWLRPLVGIPVAAALAASVVLALRRRGMEVMRSPAELARGWANRTRGFVASPADGDAVVRANVPFLLFVVAVALVWCVLGGQGGLWYQSGDWDSRNALFRDLVTHGWPVRYSVDGGWMCYYIAHWLPPALVGRALVLLGCGQGLAWGAANVALLLWTATGVTLVLLHLPLLANARSRPQLVLCVFLPLVFATPDIVGIALTGLNGSLFQKMHLEWWASNMQYSSLTTCLFWVFNQSVIPWLCTLRLVGERRLGAYVPLWACCLFAGPFPAIGLLLLMVGCGFHALWRSERKGEVLASACSPANLLAIPAALVVGLYLLSNGAGAADAHGAWTQANALPYPLYFPTSAEHVRKAVVFVVVEGALLPAVLWACGVRGPLLALSAVTLLLCPWVRTSQPADFCMRVSVPAVLCLCVMSAVALVRATGPEGALRRLGRRSIPAVFLVVLLLLGAVTPAYEVRRGVSSVLHRGIAASVYDPFKTFEDRDQFYVGGRNGWPRTNYVVDPEPGNSLFYDHLSK